MTSRRKPFIVIFFVVATELIGFGLIIPVLPQLASFYNITHVLLGVLMASFSLAQLSPNRLKQCLETRQVRFLCVLDRESFCR